MKKNLFIAAFCAALCLPAAAIDKGVCVCCKPAVTQVSTTSTALPQGVKSAFYAIKMHCGGCVQGITSTLKGLDGVEAVSADLKGQRIKVTYVSAKVSSSQIVSTLDAKGFKAKAINPDNSAKVA